MEQNELNDLSKKDLLDLIKKNHINDWWPEFFTVWIILKFIRLFISNGPSLLYWISFAVLLPLVLICYLWTSNRMKQFVDATDLLRYYDVFSRRNKIVKVICSMILLGIIAYLIYGIIVNTGNDIILYIIELLISIAVLSFMLFSIFRKNKSRDKLIIERLRELVENE